jgi:hypothetical protein
MKTKKKNTSLTIVFLCCFGWSISFGQYIDSMKVNCIYFQTEAFIPFQGGVDLQGAYRFGDNLIGIKYRYVPVTDLLDKQKDEFDVKFRTIQLSYSRLVLKNKKLAIGMLAGYYPNFSVTEKTSQISAKKNYSTLGLRATYYFFPFKKHGFFIAPTIQVNFALNDKELNVGGGVYKKHPVLQEGPSVLLGWRFNCKSQSAK